MHDVHKIANFSSACVVLISIDRFVGIKYPYSNNKMGKRSTIVISIIIIWVFSLALGTIRFELRGVTFFNGMF